MQDLIPARERDIQQLQRNKAEAVQRIQELKKQLHAHQQLKQRREHELKEVRVDEATAAPLETAIEKLKQRTLFICLHRR